MFLFDMQNLPFQMKSRRCPKLSFLSSSILTQNSIANFSFIPEFVTQEQSINVS
jgi:hypothetical protein